MNNSNQTTPFGVSQSGFPALLIFFMILQQLVFILSCVGNGLVIVIFVKYLKLKSKTNRFVISLAIADFLTGVSSFTQIFYFLYPSLSKNMVTCFLRYQVVTFTTLASVMTVTFTIFDRFVAICYPHSYQKIMTNTATNVMIIFTWLYAFVISHFPYFGIHRWTPNSLCLYEYIFVQATYSISACTLWIFCLISFLLYIFILRTAWRYFKRIRPTVATCQSNDDRNKKIEKDIRNAKVVGVVAIAFTICWAPYSSCQFRHGLYGPSSKSVECDWFVFLGLINSILNPFIYAVQRRDFKYACQKLFSRKPRNGNAREERFSTQLT